MEDMSVYMKKYREGNAGYHAVLYQNLTGDNKANYSRIIPVLDSTDLVWFLDTVKSRLPDFDLPDQVRYLSYKNDPYNLRSAETVQVLENLLRLAFSDYLTADKIKEDSFSDQIRDIAQNLLEYYWKNAAKLSAPNTEPAPLTAFTYDTLAAAMWSGDPDLFEKTSNWLTAKLNNKTVIRKLSEEMDLVHKRYTEELKQTAARLRDDFEQEQPEEVTLAPSDPDPREVAFMKFIAQPDEKYVKKWGESTNGNYVVGKYYDRYIGLTSIFDLLDKMDKVPFWNNISSRLDALSGKRLARVVYLQRGKLITEPIELPPHETVMVWRMIYESRNPVAQTIEMQVANFSEKDIYHQRALESAISLKTTTALRYVDLDQFADELKDPVIFEISDFIKVIFSLRLWMEGVFVKEAPSSREKTVALMEKNRNAKWRIANLNDWFVSSNGDRFSTKHNPEFNSKRLNGSLFILILLPAHMEVTGWRSKLIFQTQMVMKGILLCIWITTVIIILRIGFLYPCLLLFG